MTEFPRHFSASLLSMTNRVWNSLQLNSPWSLGMLSDLIRGQQFTHYQQWIRFYFTSGNRRSKLLQSVDAETRYMLNYLHPYTAQIFNNKYRNFKKLQFQYGRSRSLLLHRAYVLKKASSERMNIQTAYDLVVYRALGETWNGIYLRERNVRLALYHLFPHIELVHASGHEDYEYAIDYYLSIGGVLICALQVKPESYASTQSYILSARRSNEKKNAKFTYMTNRPVFTLLVSISGQIVDDLEYKAFVKLLTHRGS